jgi:hypothetical protein
MVEVRATFHLHLGRVLLDRGELNEALSHATQGRQLIRANLDSFGALAFAQLGPISDLGGDVLERMGRLQEAREWDRDAERLTGTSMGSARRRTVQELVRKGDHEVRTSSPKLRLAITRDASYIHKGLTRTIHPQGCLKDAEPIRRRSAQPWMPLKLFARSLPQEAERMAREGLSVIKQTRFMPGHQMLPPDEENTILEAFAGTINYYGLRS